MSDIESMKNLLSGLKQRKLNLESNQKLFLRASGLSEEIEKAIQDRDAYQKELESWKEKKKSLKSKKSEMISGVVSEIESKMNQILSFGKAVFSMNEDENGKSNLLIGWNDGKKTVPYNGLSGMQKQVFDAALANVLNADIIVIEAAELDEENLNKTLEQLSKLDNQVIVNTWFTLKSAPEPFKIVEV